jgi:MFS family permease
MRDSRISRCALIRATRDRVPPSKKGGFVLQKLWPSVDSRSSAARDVALVCAARGIRGLGDGFVIIILPAYLSAIGFDAAEVGLVATAALLGSAVTTLAMGYLAPRHDLRSFLFAGAIVMAATGLALPQVEHIAFIAVVVFFGTVNPSPGDIGMLVPLEQAMLAHEVADDQRTRAFARYSLIGTLATAAGALVAAAPDALVLAGIGRVAAFKAMFWFYAALGLAAAAVYRRLPHAQAEDKRPVAALGPSRAIVYKLAALFSLDAFAGGFIVQSLLALWLFERFDLSLAAASLFFFWSSVLSAFSFPVAAWLSVRIGLVNTMVFTHIPSSICLVAAAFAPNLAVALALLLVRSALSQMDVPTRTSYVMAVVTPAERTAAASVTAVPRTLTSSISPALSGVMLAGSFTGLPLVMCGVLKIVYDVILLISFRHIRPPEENRRESAAHDRG